MQRFITLVEKPNPQSGHTEITRLGNAAEGWFLTREPMVTCILDRTTQFLIVNPYTDIVSELGWMCPKRGAPYVVAQTAGVMNEDLLSIPLLPQIAWMSQRQERSVSPIAWVLGAVGFGFLLSVAAGDNRKRRRRK